MPEPEYLTVTMGNPQVPNHHRDPDTDEQVLSWDNAPNGEAVTTFQIPADWDTQRALAVVTGNGGLGEREFQTGPLWVQSDNTTLASLLGAFYDCEVR